MILMMFSVDVNAILAEEAGLHDWTLKHIGVAPLAAHFIKSADSVAVVTKETIAALGVKDGSLKWRVKTEIGESFLTSDADESLLVVATREGDKNHCRPHRGPWPRTWK